MAEDKQTTPSLASARDNDPVVYFILLVVIQILIFVFAYIGQYPTAYYMVVFRIIILTIAYFLRSTALAGYYAIALLIGTLILVDPVGLWITGRGTARTQAQNGVCLMSFLLSLIGCYLSNKHRVSIMKHAASEFADGKQAYSNPNEPKEKEFEDFAGEGYSLN